MRDSFFVRTKKHATAHVSNKKMIALITSFLMITCIAKAQNPIVQTAYTADPGPMVYNGTVYLYTGRDEDNSKWFTMNEWRLYSSTDMVNWTDHGAPLTVETFKWAKSDAWASQCIERNGKIYWYICTNDKLSNGMAIGVAVSDKPTGPFKDALGKPLVSGGWGYIDPTVFIDDDGQAYLYWGNPGVFYVKLNTDMISYSGSIVEIEQTVENFGGPKEPKKDVKYEDLYEEGPWVYKRNNNYYLLFASGGVPERISYAMSDKPTGPWKYKGQVMPLQDTKSFTNHCGVIDFKGNSYFFYHTGKLAGGGGFTRSVAVESFKYNQDGTIPIINATNEGVNPVGTLNPYIRVEAETIAWGDSLKTESNDKTGVYVSNIYNNKFIKVRAVDLGYTAPRSLSVSVASARQGGVIEVRADAVNGVLLGTVEVPGTGGWENWKTIKTTMNGKLTGVHDLFFVFKGRKGARLFNFDFWQFYK